MSSGAAEQIGAGSRSITAAIALVCGLALEGALAGRHLVQHRAQAKMSERGSAALPSTCSGDMY